MAKKSKYIFIFTIIGSIAGTIEVSLLTYQNITSCINRNTLEHCGTHDDYSQYTTLLPTNLLIIFLSKLIGYYLYVAISTLTSKSNQLDSRMQIHISFLKQILLILPAAISNICGTIVLIAALSLSSAYFVPLGDVVKYMALCFIQNLILKFPLHRVTKYGIGFCVVGIVFLLLGEVFYVLHFERKPDFITLLDIISILMIAVFKGFSILYMELMVVHFDNNKHKMYSISNALELIMVGIYFVVNIIMKANYFYIESKTKSSSKITDRIQYLGDNFDIFWFPICLALSSMLSYMSYFYIIRKSMSPYKATLSDSLKAFLFYVGYIILLVYSDERKENGVKDNMIKNLAFSLFGYAFLIFGSFIMSKMLYYKRSPSDYNSNISRNPLTSENSCQEN